MGIKQNDLDLANFIVDDFKDFNPAHPDSEAAFSLGEIFSKDGGGRGTPSGSGGTAPTGTPGASPAANPPAGTR
jgi:hypothetical protein